jgi:hypothetical protein
MHIDRLVSTHMLLLLELQLRLLLLQLLLLQLQLLALSLLLLLQQLLLKLPEVHLGRLYPWLVYLTPSAHPGSHVVSYLLGRVHWLRQACPIITNAIRAVRSCCSCRIHPRPDVHTLCDL